MENKKILETAGKELEKRVSAVSNLNQTIEGTRSNLLDILIADENPKTREELGNPIKEELEKKIQIAKNHKPPRTKYIENMNKIMVDLDTRIQGQKADNERTHLLDLDKKEGFNRAVLESFVTQIFEAAKTTSNLETQPVYQKLTSQPEYVEDVIRFLEHRKDELTDAKQKANINAIIKRLKSPKKTPEPTVQETTEEKNKETKKTGNIRNKTAGDNNTTINNT